MIDNLNRFSKPDFTGVMLPGFSFRRSPRRRAVALMACGILVSSTLFIGVAAAQPSHGPIVNGRQLQPTQEQLESTKDKDVVEWDRWNSRVQPEVDRLYQAIMRAATAR